MDPSDAVETPVTDDVFVVRVRLEGSARRSRVSVKHVGTGRILHSESVKDIEDFIRLMLRKTPPEHSGGVDSNDISR